MTPLEDVISRSQKLSPRTRELYLRCVREFLKGAPHPSQWTGPVVESWRDRLTGRGLSPQTVNIHLRAIRYASQRLAARGDGRDFATYAEFLKQGPQRRPANVLNESQLRGLLAACAAQREAATPTDLRDLALIGLGGLRGLRRDSLARAQLDQLDLRRRILTVPVKGGTLHAVPLDAATLGCLMPWVTWLRAHGGPGPLFRSLPRPGLDQPKRITVGRGLTPQGIYYIIARRAEAAGIEHVHPHALRHTFVSLARARGYQDWEIALVTGHKPSRGGLDVPMLDTYTHRVAGMREVTIGGEET